MKLMGLIHGSAHYARFVAEQASQRPTSSRHELNLQVAVHPAQPSSAQQAQPRRRPRPRPRPALALWMRLQRAGCGCGPISRPLFACCTALYLRLWRCFQLKLISFGRLAGWLAAWLLVKWLGPMQRWLIPRSSRVKVGRHSVGAKKANSNRNRNRS